MGRQYLVPLILLFLSVLCIDGAARDINQKSIRYPKPERIYSASIQGVREAAARTLIDMGWILTQNSTDLVETQPRQPPGVVYKIEGFKVSISLIQVTDEVTKAVISMPYVYRGEQGELVEESETMDYARVEPTRSYALGLLGKITKELGSVKSTTETRKVEKVESVEKKEVPSQEAITRERYSICDIVQNPQKREECIERVKRYWESKK